MNWSPKHSRNLAKFLQSDTGQELKDGFKALEPRLKAGNTIESVALQAAAFFSYREMKNWIKELMIIVPEQKEQSNEIDMSALDVKVD